MKAGVYVCADLDDIREKLFRIKMCNFTKDIEVTKL